MTEPPSPFQDPELVRALVDDGSVLFGAMTGDGTVTWMSSGAQALLGWAPEELPGTHALELIHPDDHDILGEIMAEEARGSDDRSVTSVRLKHANGRWVAFEFAGLDQRDADGAGTYLVWGRPFEYMTRLLTFLDTLLTDADLPQVLEHVIAWQDVTILHSASLILLRADDGYDVVAASEGMPRALVTGVPADATVPESWRRMLGGGTVIHDVDLGEIPAAMRAAAEQAGFEACWAVPVGPAGAPDPKGVVVTWRSRPGVASATQRRRLLEGAQIVRLALQWSSAQTNLHTAATTDPLTGLANRAVFDAQLAQRPDRPCALLLCDLDDFKSVNDHHGHLMGDRVLQEVASRLRASVGPDDLVARIGGDEFAVWHRGERHEIEAGAAALSDRLTAAIGEPIVAGGRSHRVGCSVGITVVDPDDPGAGDLDELLGRADRALYQAKATRKRASSN